MISYRHYIDEAIIALGYIKPECGEWLTSFAEQYSQNGWGDVARLARTMGEPMAAERRKSLKLGNIKISVDAYEALTEKGRQVPTQAIELTVQRALVGFHRDRENASVLNNTDFEKVEVHAWNPCPEFTAASLTNQVVERRKAPSFPLPGCSRTACDCRLSRHYDWSQDPNFEEGDEPHVIEVNPVIAKSLKVGDGKAASFVKQPSPKKKRLFNFVRNLLALWGLVALLAIIFH